MKDHTVQQTQSTKVGTSETNSKTTRLKKKTSHIKEIEATVHDDGKVTYSDEITGEEKTYAIDSMEDFRFAIGEAQLMQKKNLEVSHRLFDTLTLGKATPYIIFGNPAVKVYREGSMDRIEKLEGLTIEDLLELKAKKAKKEAEIEKARKDKIKAEIEL